MDYPKIDLSPAVDFPRRKTTRVLINWGSQTMDETLPHVSTSRAPNRTGILNADV